MRVMNGGDILYPGQYIESSNGLYALRYASDGNFIVSKIIIFVLICYVDGLLSSSILLLIHPVASFHP